MVFNNGFDSGNLQGPEQELHQIEALLQQLKSFEQNPSNVKVMRDIEHMRRVLDGQIPRNFVHHVTPVIFGSLQFNDPSPEGPDPDVLFVGDGAGDALWWTANNKKVKKIITRGWPIGKVREFDIHHISADKIDASKKPDDYLVSIVLSGKALYAEDKSSMDEYRAKAKKVIGLNSRIREGVLLALQDTVDIRQSRR